ncbi:hypothetical protein [Oricola sp.]|uniref:hypothetical protein n=1 Tax=Oricola sp. TaxID=1979950 RepID=UPI003BA961E3
MDVHYKNADDSRGAKWAGEPINDIRHPRDIAEKWTDAELAAIGLARTADLDVVDQSTPGAAETTIVKGEPAWNASTNRFEVSRTRQDIAVTVDMVKDEARRRILALYPDWKQANMTARGVDLLNIESARALTSAESAEKTAIQAAWDAIKAIRAKSDEIEAMTPIPADFTADSYWP